MESIGIFDAKTRLSELVARAAEGESFRITKHGQPVARIIPEGGSDAQRIAAAAKCLRSFRGVIAGLDPEQVRADCQEGRQGIIRGAQQPQSAELFALPRPSPRENASIVAALLDERRAGR